MCTPPTHHLKCVGLFIGIIFLPEKMGGVSRIEELKKRLEDELRRNETLNGLLEDITRDADKRCRDYTFMMDQAAECLAQEVRRSRAKDRAFEAMLNQLGPKRARKVGEWLNNGLVDLYTDEVYVEEDGEVKRVQDEK